VRSIPGLFSGGPTLGKRSRNTRNIRDIQQGDIADTILFIQKGKVKMTVLSEHGKEAVVGILAEGQFFGEDASMGENYAPQPARPWNSA